MNICTLGFYSVHSWSEQHPMKSSMDNVILSYVCRSSTLVWIRQDQLKVLSKCVVSQSAANVNLGWGGGSYKMIWFVNQLKSVRMNFLEYWYEGIWDLRPTHQKTLKISIHVCHDQEIETLTDALRSSPCNAPSQVMESIYLFYELCRCEVHCRLSWDARKNSRSLRMLWCRPEVAWILVLAA